MIAAAVKDDPDDDGFIRPGFSAELDGVHDSARNAKTWIASLERVERERTGIKSLKVGFNKVFGYYIEVTHANTGGVPADYIRKQTLTNAERYITPDLKEYESLVLHADERIAEIEARLLKRDHSATSRPGTPPTCWPPPAPWRNSTSPPHWPRWPPATTTAGRSSTPRAASRSPPADTR